MDTRRQRRRRRRSEPFALNRMISIKSNQSTAITSRMSPRRIWALASALALLAIGSSLLFGPLQIVGQTTSHLLYDQYAFTGSDQQPLQLDPSAEFAINNELLAVATAAASEHQASIDQQQQQQHASPGHYEFDVAPKMEPPTVRKPPYRQTAQTCPGSDLLGGFSPRDTLCGDLNQGEVPLNPLGQSIADQAYPFELIKNKTLQFLAKALPVLKLEYETIPKVARYLPANHLLNPTHGQSPLGDTHLHQLNQRFANSPSHDLLFDANSGLLRRKRRSTSGKQQHQASVTVAELTPNATVVVSSAHSQAGRIQARRSSLSSSDSHHHHHHHLMITKDGFRQISAPNSHGQQAATTSGAGNSSSQPSPTSAALSSVVVVVPSGGGASRDHIEQRKSLIAADEASLSTRHDANNQQPQQQVTNNHAGNRQQQQQAPSRADNQAGAQTSPSATATGRNHANQGLAGQAHRANEASLQASNRLASEPNEPNEHNNSIDSQLAARSTGGSGGGGGGSSASPTSANGQQQPKLDNVSSSGRQNGGQSKNSLTSSPATQRSRLNCAGLGSTIASTVCQTAAALIEGDKPPAWVQVARQIGNLYAAGSSTDSLASWPLLGLLGVGQGANTVNGGQSDAAPADQTDAKSSSGAKQSPLSSSSSSFTIWNILTPLANMLTPSMQKDSGDHHHHHHQQQQQQQPSHTSVQTKRNDNGHKTSPSLVEQLSASTLTKMALAGWATTALAGMVEYLVPSAFGSASSTFARRKKPFDPSETFVDTPASLAALSAANAKSAPGSIGFGSGGNAISKQPPTPCPSVEEYISPTFARNYQGAWKYVVQIPHEGYFTQTIQRSSCVRQKCEFTDGVCHEAPRWVSLLVAEIYYPNAVFGSAAQSGAAGLAGEQHVSPGSLQSNLVTSSTSSQSQQVALGHPSSEQQLQQQLYASQVKQQVQRPKQLMTQDPLQMTDSFNTYNHNLNSAAFLSAAANQLGIDPTNVAQMQQLAELHNHQLTQRNGHLTRPQYTLTDNNQLQVAESRASHNVVAPQPARQHATHSVQQQAAQLTNDLNPNMSYSEYIRALAAETLRQNPHLTIDDLIKSLQLQTSRKKRDLHEQNGLNQQQQQQQQQFNQLQQRSGSPEATMSLNDLGAPSSSQHRQVYNAPNAGDQMKQQMSLQQEHSSNSRGQQQQQRQTNPESNLVNTNQESQQAAASATSSAQTECDGHDKIGCYVVRVYYDWFLVNGSCKCWKTSAGTNANQQQQQQGSGNSFLRRIFTG